ncbi:MAG TPA: bifunctional phosphoribosylaminoimidazolecarboxamide formyltransferase/IMP cyclohydrolase, partial [Cyclobacteriaceae bacterium]|nr:bifunctional phosphoribosylaminoimidazolecarboxamide formyltransferase/IMP cyclohydrolase [Cyclobacteriaceae bacterium]
MSNVKITRALISVFYKDNLEPIVHILGKAGVEFVSTGGTQEFIEKLGYKVTPVEKLTGYPSIFGGRVKTLHPAIFGGILYRREDSGDVKQATEYKIPAIDLVIVDLYPFEETVAKFLSPGEGLGEADIIEKIDIGGISLIRGAAKNFNDVIIVASRNQYSELQQLLETKKCSTDLSDRRYFAAMAFDVTSHYDSAIFNYFNSGSEISSFKRSIQTGRTLRYGENPHQQGKFFGNLEEIFEQLNGKELSYNNLVDVDAAVNLVQEFNSTAFVIIKHTNACGVATGSTVKDAYLKAFQADTVSAFGGVLATNKKVDLAAAEEINKLFFEILIAPGYEADALELLKSKKNRMILLQKSQLKEKIQFKSLLNGVIEQDHDLKTDSKEDLKVATKRAPSASEVEALLFAGKIAKHTKSNTIVLAVEGQLLASGVGQTSRVDALKQAIEKAKSFGFSLQGAVMASDAFFPFADCVEIAHQQGIQAVIQPGGSVRDQ